MTLLTEPDIPLLPRFRAFRRPILKPAPSLNRPHPRGKTGARPCFAQAESDNINVLFLF
jgi:hypothetical protein